MRLDKLAFAAATVLGVLASSSGAALARPTDVTVVNQVRTYPAVVDQIYIHGASGGTSSGVLGSRALPAGYDFQVVGLTGYAYGPGTLLYTYLFDPAAHGHSGFVPADPSGASSYWLFNESLQMLLTSHAYLDAGFTVDGYHTVDGYASGYWISESTGQIVPRPAGFKNDPRPRRPGA